MIKNLYVNKKSGGIHMYWNKDCIIDINSDKYGKYKIIDVDCTSMYPMLSIKHNFKPAHLGDAFSEQYLSLFEERKKYDKKNPKNYIIKILLNSSYGLSNEENNALYDPLMTISICLTGQLVLLKLIEDQWTKNGINCFAANTKLHYWCYKTTLTAGKYTT